MGRLRISNSEGEGGRMRTAWPYVVAVALGAVIGWLDLHASEVQGAVLLMLMCAFGMGLAAPERAWRWGVLIGLGVPVVHVVASACGYRPPHPPQPNDLATLLALIPGLIGASVGAAIGGLRTAR